MSTTRWTGHTLSGTHTHTHTHTLTGKVGLGSKHNYRQRSLLLNGIAVADLVRIDSSQSVFRDEATQIGPETALVPKSPEISRDWNGSGFWLWRRHRPSVVVPVSPLVFGCMTFWFLCEWAGEIHCAVFGGKELDTAPRREMLPNEHKIEDKNLYHSFIKLQSLAKVMLQPPTNVDGFYWNAGW